MKGSAKVEFSNLQTNCFATVSWPLSYGEAPGNVKVLAIQTENEKTHFLSVSSSAPSHPNRTGNNSINTIKINGRYAQALEIKDGEQVLFWETRDTGLPTNVSTAEVSCCSKDDWEILESNAEHVSSQLLHQLRVVYTGQTFPFWLSKSMIIYLKIDKITPAVEYGVLSENSEIIIPSLSAKTVVPRKLKKHQRLRVHPLIIPHTVTLLPSEVLLLSNKFHGFTYKAYFKTRDIPENQDFIFVQVIASNEQTGESPSFSIKLFFLDTVENQLFKTLAPLTNVACVYLHPTLLESVKLETKSWVWIHPIPETSVLEFPNHSAVSRSYSCYQCSLFNETDFCGFKSTLTDCLNFIKSSLSLDEYLFENGFRGPEFGNLLIHGACGSGKSSLANATANILMLPPFFVHHEYIGCAKLRGKKAESMEKELLKRIHLLMEKQPSILILDDIDVLIAAPKTEQSQQEEFLQYKISETLLETLMKLKNERISVICTARNVESVNNYWKSRVGFHFFQKYIKIPAASKTERVEIFTSCLKPYLNHSGSEDFNCIKQIASKQDTKCRHNQIVPSNEGNNDTIRTKIGALQDKSNFDEIFQDLCCILGRNDELTKQIVFALGETHEQNATPQFLVNVAKKWGAYLQSHQDYDKPPPATGVVAGGEHVSSSVGGDAPGGINNIKTNEDVNERMKAFNEILQEEIRFSADLNELDKRKTPLQQQHKLKISWDSIGGLTAVKEDLKKILEWPIKFPQFFKNAPVRLPCGILFYGYPGTGKTIMGLAIQTIVNVKFIHVKGPELLSKYIGASEQAVQDVFNRARESRPCILFFDEFDSLVPRRGHDSSGVSDRVVNQFLSEMDGVDGGIGEGVYLIAATSRPDLIDPAVLRPGRLDKHLFFDFPSKTERQEIIKIMSTQVGLQLEHDSDWNEICELTEGFTGADLNALMFTTQLSVVSEHLSRLDNDGAKLKGQSTSSHSTAAASTVCTQEIQVTKESLMSALKDFKPSVQGQEYRKFQAIYREFTIGKKGGAKELSSIAGTKLEADDGSKQWRMQPGKRATLA